MCKSLFLKWDVCVLRGNAFSSLRFHTSGGVNSISLFTHSRGDELVIFGKITGLAYAGFLLFSFRNVPFCRGHELSASMPNIVEGPL